MLHSIIVLVALILAPLTAAADIDGNVPDPKVNMLWHAARELARRGECTKVAVLAGQVREIDAPYFAAVFAVDSEIAHCRQERSEPKDVAPAVIPDERPDLSSVRIGGEVLASAAGGAAGVIVGAFVGFYAARNLLQQTGQSSGFQAIGIGGVAGFLIGSPLAVYLAGRVGDQTCSLTGALVGSILGTAPGLLLAAGEAGSNVGRMFDIEVGVVVAGSIAGSVIGCNLGRRYKSPPPPPMVGSLVQLRDGHVGFGIPLVARGRIRDAAVTNVPLFIATF